MSEFLFTSESVTEGHPDKICDQISDAVLDAILAQDPMARVACETAVTTGMVMVMGEISTSCYVDIPKTVRTVVEEIGYTRAKYGFDIFEVTFKKAYFSQLLQIRKPKPEGFKAIIEEQGLLPEETLFIDDSPQHIVAARTVGLNAYHLAGGETMEQLFMCNLELREGVL